MSRLMNVKKIWILSVFVTEIFKQVDLQYAMFPMPYFLVPAPIPVMLSAPIPIMLPALIPKMIPAQKKATSTTPRNPPCPPCVCLPSCSPAFFSYCSLCHLKCRCKSAKDTPDPLPSGSNLVYAMPVPSPPVIGSPPVAILIPDQDSSESLEEYTDSSSSDSY